MCWIARIMVGMLIWGLAQQDCFASNRSNSESMYESTGSIRGQIIMEGACIANPYRSLRIFAVEASHLSRPRNLTAPIQSDGKFHITFRARYTNYYLELRDVRAGRMLRKIRAPAYHSPRFFEIKIDCQKEIIPYELFIR